MTILSSARLQREIIWLKLSALYAALIGISGIFIGIRIDSGAITLDAVYSVICFIACVFLIVLCKKIETPADERYHFGYYKFEPAMISIEAILIIVSCLFALVTAIKDILHPNELPHYLVLAMVFQLFAAITATLLAIVIWVVAKKHRSMLLKSQAIILNMDGIQSWFMTFGFAIALIIKNTAYSWLVPYVDPVLVFVLVIIIIRQPLILFKENFLDLLDASPGLILHDKIRQITDEICQQEATDIKIRDVRLRRAGRKLFVYVICHPAAHVSSEKLLNFEKNISVRASEHHEHIEVQLVLKQV